MNQILIENWNTFVAKNDIVFFLGDFGMGTTEHLLKINQQLNGQKICIRGNHDGTPSKMYKIGKHIVELLHRPNINI